MAIAAILFNSAFLTPSSNAHKRPQPRGRRRIDMRACDWLAAGGGTLPMLSYHSGAAGGSMLSSIILPGQTGVIDVPAAALEAASSYRCIGLPLTPERCLHHNPRLCACGTAVQMTPGNRPPRRARCRVPAGLVTRQS